MSTVISIEDSNNDYNELPPSVVNETDGFSSIAQLLDNGQTLIRKHLIYSAVNFLNNPRIYGNSSEKKKVFLLKKGLTQDEIDLAFELCIVRPSSDLTLKNELEMLSSTLGETATSASRKSFFGRFFNFLLYLTVFSGFAYGSYCFYQNKIRPYFDKSLKSKKDQLDETSDNIRELKEHILELNKNVSIVNEFMRTYCRARDDSMLSLKSDLSSIKSLLVNKNQFPAVPTIPKWQFDSSTKQNEKRNATNAAPTASVNGDGSNIAFDSME